MSSNWRNVGVFSAPNGSVQFETKNKLGGDDKNTADRAPRVAVLLATHNAGTWLRQQLDSIFAQQGVNLHLFVSDDMSTDNTVSIIADYADRFPVTLLPRLTDKLGNANRNFLRLISDSEVADCDYVAFSDHDDIWHPNKLRRAVDCIVQRSVDAYSSDVIAFWADGREKLVLKSNPQRRYDYLFEGPGPGCTFVFVRKSFENLRVFVLRQFKAACAVKVHDWMIYAYARTHGWDWYIDNWPSMLYRQHDSNEIGVNSGWQAIRRRLWEIRSGKFQAEVLRIADLVSAPSWIVVALRRLGAFDRLQLCLMAHEFRRRRLHRWLLALFFLFMPKPENPSH